MLIKYVKTRKKILHIAVFYKSRLSKMLATEVNKIKDRLHFYIPIFEDIQLCSGPSKDSSTVKVLKICFVSGRVAKTKIRFFLFSHHHCLIKLSKLSLL